MSSKFYDSIISENEQEIENSALKKASRDISIYYKISSSKEGLTPPNYNIPAYCCAYLYKYATIHTGFATKYFRKMFFKKEAKTILYSNKNIKICCLGGGPGTEIVGIFKALAICPSFHKRVAKVSVLDVCQGWETSFTSIMSNLIDGKDKQVPDTFFRHKFKKEFIHVDLQGPLPDNIRKVISDADVICMMKFVSEFSKERSTCLLKVLGELFKNKALILYIDNFKRDAFESVDCFSRSPDFKVVLGPLEDEKFGMRSSSDVATYGCKSLTYARMSVIGWIKTSNESHVIQESHVFDASLSASYSSLTDDGTIGTESEIKDSDVLTNSDEEWEDIRCDKYTQTEQDYFSNSFKNEMFPSAVEVELAALREALADLLTLMERFISKKKMQREKFCCLHACY